MYKCYLWNSLLFYTTQDVLQHGELRKSRGHRFLIKMMKNDN